MVHEKAECLSELHQRLPASRIPGKLETSRKSTFPKPNAENKFLADAVSHILETIIADVFRNFNECKRQFLTNSLMALTNIIGKSTTNGWHRLLVYTPRVYSHWNFMINCLEIFARSSRKSREFSIFRRPFVFFWGTLLRNLMRLQNISISSRFNENCKEKKHKKFERWFTC